MYQKLRWVYPDLTSICLKMSSLCKPKVDGKSALTKSTRNTNILEYSGAIWVFRCYPFGIVTEYNHWSDPIPWCLYADIFLTAWDTPSNP